MQKRTTGVKTRPIHDPYIESTPSTVSTLGALGDRNAPFNATLRGPAGIPTNARNSKSFASQLEAATRGTAKGK